MSYDKVLQNYNYKVSIREHRLYEIDFDVLHYYMDDMVLPLILTHWIITKSIDVV
jgi:hypothetical protein